MSIQCATIPCRKWVGKDKVQDASRLGVISSISCFALSFFSSPSRCRTLEFGGLTGNLRYHGLQYYPSPILFSKFLGSLHCPFHLAWPKNKFVLKNARTQGLLRNIRKVISSYLPSPQARSQKNGQTSLYFSLRKKEKGIGERVYASVHPSSH